MCEVWLSGYSVVIQSTEKDKFFIPLFDQSKMVHGRVEESRDVSPSQFWYLNFTSFTTKGIESFLQKRIEIGNGPTPYTPYICQHIPIIPLGDLMVPFGVSL